MNGSADPAALNKISLATRAIRADVPLRGGGGRAGAAGEGFVEWRVRLQGTIFAELWEERCGEEDSEERADAANYDAQRRSQNPSALRAGAQVQCQRAESSGGQRRFNAPQLV